MHRLERPAFGELLTKAITARGWSLRAFCREVKLNTGNLMEIIKGDRNPPLAHLEPWADALELRGKSRRAFLEAGWLANSPREVRFILNALRRKIMALEAKLATSTQGHRPRRRSAQILSP